MFCGLYSTKLDLTDKAKDLIARTYIKINKTTFKQPFLYDKLNVKQWMPKKADGSHALPYETELHMVEVQDTPESEKRNKLQINPNIMSRWDIINREQDLKLFIKVPASSKSSIVILEGDFRNFNDVLYLPSTEKNLIMNNCFTGSNVPNHESTSIGGYSVKLCDTAYKQSLEANDRNYLVLAPTTECVNNRARVWDGSISKPSVVEDGWCKISCGEELAWVINNGGSVSIDGKVIKHFKLTDDIYLNNIASINWLTGGIIEDGIEEYSIQNWFNSTMVTAFSGTVDGDGHTIYGLYLNNNVAGASCGLFPLIDADGVTTIQNLGINYAYSSAEEKSIFIGSLTVPKSKIKLDKWQYTQNHSIINFGNKNRAAEIKVDVNAGGFTPISKLQLLAFNTGESYPFSDRLIEYLSSSAITPIDKIPDNIKRVQKVMRQNQHNFRIDGLWENKMQKITYDYLMNAGPIKVSATNSDKLVDERLGYHPTLGFNSKSTLYDVLGYIDKDVEKWYSSWTNKDGKAKILDNIKNVDIYDGLYDI
jgi:hypothetical protein